MEKEIHLKDILDKKDIDIIYVYNDIKDAHFFSDEILLEDEDGGEILSNNLDMSLMSDDWLLKLSIDEVKEIQNIDLLDRIAKLDKSKLSKEQIEKLKEVYKQKIIIDKQDVERLIEEFKQCNRLFITGTPKNHIFIIEHDLYVEECLEIIHKLKVSDYYTNTRSYNRRFLGNDLIIFEPSNVVLSNGKNLSNIKIYIKLDLTESEDNIVMAVSFHQTDKQNKLPYSTNENLDEDIEKHEKLNPLLFEDDELKPEIKEAEKKD